MKKTLAHFFLKYCQKKTVGFPPLFIFPLLFFFLVPAADSLAYQYKNTETGADFLLVGVGVLRQNLTSVDGNAISFQESDRGLPLDYSNRSYLSLYGEGLLNHDWEFVLRSQYDQEDPDQEFTFFLKLMQDENYIILGDHEEGSFLDTTFTASDDKLRGITMHGQTDKVSGTVIAGAVRGESVTEEIRGDGTSGRYRLDEAPVIRGSETIRIEIRDRTSPLRLLKSTSQLRGRDYTIDYDRGEILFNFPVEESDFRGNPVFIVVSYQYDSPGGLYKRARYGTRVTVSPNTSATIGATYLGDGPWDGDFSSEILDERQETIGSDLRINIDDQHILSMEVARSEVPVVEAENDDKAMRLDFSTIPVKAFQISGNYWRVGKDFLTFGNRDLAAGNVISKIGNDSPFYFKSRDFDFDLDPNGSAALGTDMESYGLSAAYDMGFHTASVGFRNSRDNIPGDSSNPINHHDTLFASLTKLEPDATDYMIGTEIFIDSGEGEDAIADSQTSRLIGGARKGFAGVDLTGPISVQGVYQFEQYDDQEEEENSSKSHDILGRMEIEPPVDLDLLIYAEQGVNFLYEEREDRFSNRTDLSLIGFDGMINRYLELNGSARYRTFHDLIDDQQTRTEQTYDLRWSAKPLDILRTQIRLEYRKDEDHLSQSTNSKTLFGGGIWWDVTSNLLLTVNYDYELNQLENQNISDESSSYDDLLLRLDWRPLANFSLFAYYRLEYDELETAPLDPTRVRTTTELLGMKYRINQDFEFVTAYRRKKLDDEANNDKIKIYGELAYTINKYLSVAPGYEYNRYTQEIDEEEYEANVFYISLIGKL